MNLRKFLKRYGKGLGNLNGFGIPVEDRYYIGAVEDRYYMPAEIPGNTSKPGPADLLSRPLDYCSGDTRERGHLSGLGDDTSSEDSFWTFALSAPIIVILFLTYP